VDNGEIEDDVARACDRFLSSPGRKGRRRALVAAQSVARFGYMARVAEWEAEHAREPVDG
jgi:hypothetical protein